jgi:hypothetical protein
LDFFFFSLGSVSSQKIPRVKEETNVEEILNTCYNKRLSSDPSLLRREVFSSLKQTKQDLLLFQIQQEEI